MFRVDVTRVGVTKYHACTPKLAVVIDPARSVPFVAPDKTPGPLQSKHCLGNNQNSNNDDRDDKHKYSNNYGNTNHDNNTTNGNIRNNA